MLEQIDLYTKVTVPAKVECPRYCCRLIRGVTIGESPVWMKRALEAAGMRPISNVVDVTNYVMLELGHPLHAFDFDTLAGSEVIVRMAKEGEPLTIIDGTELKLTAEDLVIADAKRPVALAGVMGGKQTEVTAQTTNILLEAAYFDPPTIRKTSKRYRMATESAYRFERGTDRERLTVALNRAAQLIHELAGGEVAKGFLDAHVPPTEPTPIVLTIERVNRLLGLELPSSEIADYLVRLGFEIRRSERDTLVVVPPSHRVDVSRDVDLIEDVARLYNYNRIPSRMPRVIPRLAFTSTLQRVIAESRRAMVAEGFCEAMSYNFIGEEQARLVGFDPALQPHIANPLTVDQSIMRPNLLPGVLTAVGLNQKQGEQAIALFEVGKAWVPGAAAGRIEDERHELAIALAGPAPIGWAAAARAYDYFDLKGVVETLFSRWADSAISVTPLTDSPAFHPGRSGAIQWMGRAIGELGEIHPDLAEAFDLRGSVLAARIDLDVLAELVKDRKASFREIPRLPGSQRDLAIVIDQATPAGDVLAGAREAGGELVESVALFDVYQGEHMAVGKKSLALRFWLRSAEKTLTEDEIGAAMDQVLKQLKKRFGAALRA